MCFKDKCCSIFSKKNDKNNAQQSIYDYQVELTQIFQEAEDKNRSNEFIIESLNRLNLPETLRPKLKEFRNGYDDFTLLHVAAKTARASLCSFLINNYTIDRDVLTKSRCTPLQLLVKYNTIGKHSNQDPSYEEKKQRFLDTYKILLEKRTDVNNQDENGASALHFAAHKNNYEATVQLLKCPDLKTNMEDKNLMTSLNLAIKHGHDDVAFLLIDRTDAEHLCSPRTVHMSSPVHLVCRNKNEKVELLRKMLHKLKELSEKAGKDAQGNLKINYVDRVIRSEDPVSRTTLVHTAIKNNHLNIVELLFNEFTADKETKESKTGNLAIHAAAKNGTVPLLRILQKYDAVSFKTNAEQKNALHIAAEANSFNFLKEFLEFELALINNVETDESYFCACRCDFADHVPSVKIQNKQRYTPLMTALAYGNHKCVEEIVNVWGKDNLDLDTKDIDGNNIYHLMAKYNNTESLKFILAKFYNRTAELLFEKNKNDETVIHLACQTGNLEIIKILLNKIYESTNVSANSLLYGQNKDGQTCFHIACAKGHSNIVSYFLKERKLNLFLDYTDNNSNTCLHLATENGHSSIVDLLLEYDLDLDVKNEQNLTALDLSCRMGSFEISKMLISKYSVITHSHTPLHTACHEGAHEVVRLLLEKGALIDKLDEKNQNCLDIAIARGHNEVVKVLLNDPNWHKLIRTTNLDHELNMDEDELNQLSVIPNANANESALTSVQLAIESNEAADGTNPVDPKGKKKNKKKEKSKEVAASTALQESTSTKLIENPELYAMFEKKMWDGFKMILNKCEEEGGHIMNFSKLDMSVFSIERHPLMLIARSGQESLLKHKAVGILLDLKWKLIPRFAFYFNIFFYLFFMVLLTIYSLELANEGTIWYQEYLENVAEQNVTITEFDKHYILGLIPYEPDAPIFVLLVTIIFFNIMKELFQLLVIEGLSYFVSMQNVIELLTYFLTLGSILSNNYPQKTAFGSVGVLMAFLVFPLYIQKLKIFGVYVVAFCRTLTNSAKFLPIFLIIYIGFFLSFKIRSNFGVAYFDSTVFSLIRTLTMVSGELDTMKMGLDGEDASVPNYILYLLFIIVMCTILINLFVGIAVGEIKTVLDEADIQQISMRIMFVLRIQSAIYPFRHTAFAKLLNMNYTVYDMNKKSALMRSMHLFWLRVQKVFASKEPNIILQDPQKRLEDSFLEMSAKTNEQIRSIKSLFDNQVSDVRTKLNNSSVRVEDGLNEMNRNTTSYLDNLIEALSRNSKLMETRIDQAEAKLDNSVIKNTQRAIDDLNYMRMCFEDRLGKIEQKLNKQIEEVSRATLSYLDLLKNTFLTKSSDLEASLNKSERNLFDCTVDSSKLLNNELVAVKAQADLFKSEIQSLGEQVAVIKDTLTRTGPGGSRAGRGGI